MSADTSLVQVSPSAAQLATPSLRLPRGLLSLIGLIVTAALLSYGYQESLMPVTVQIDGQARSLRTHQPTVGDVLSQAEVRLFPQDYVTPPLDTRVAAGLKIEVRRALAVELEADGRTSVQRTQGISAAAVLQEAGVSLAPRDEVLVNEQVVSDPALPFRLIARAPMHGLNSPALLDAIHVRVRRAIPLQITDAGLPITLWTTARTIREAFDAAGMPVYDADWFNLSLDTPVCPGLQVVVDRSRPVTIVADGRTIATRTRVRTVGEVLAQAGVVLAGKDYTLPGVEAALPAGTTVQVVRVMHEFLIEEEKIGYETLWRPDPELELDQSIRAQAGADGARKRRVRVDFENGAEVRRQLEAEYIDPPPTPEIWHYGTRVVIRDLVTPDGTLQYWRKLRMHATAYTAATSGKSRDHPAYGLTRVGWQATRGVIAVDPRVIKLFTPMYVPGYGVGTAADTGGLIRGMRIDLAYDEDKLEGWYRWVDVYLLAPPPPANQIRYRLPR